MPNGGYGSENLDEVIEDAEGKLKERLKERNRKTNNNSIVIEIERQERIVKEANYQIIRLYMKLGINKESKNINYEETIRMMDNQLKEVR